MADCSVARARGFVASWRTSRFKDGISVTITSQKCSGISWPSSGTTFPKSSLKNSFLSHKSDPSPVRLTRSMTTPDVSKILKECSEDVISKLHFFRSSNGKAVATFLEGSALFQQNDHLERLIRFGLVQENPLAPSFTFYRERMEDFVFVKCDVEIAKLVGKIKKIEGFLDTPGPQSEKQRQEIAQYDSQIVLLKELKQILAVMFRDSVSIPSNERFADIDGSSRGVALKILSSYSANSSISNPLASRSFASAGTMSPVCRRRTSPMRSSVAFVRAKSFTRSRSALCQLKILKYLTRDVRSVISSKIVISIASRWPCSGRYTCTRHLMQTAFPNP